MRLESFSKIGFVTSVWRLELSARGTPARRCGDWRTFLWYPPFAVEGKLQPRLFCLDAHFLLTAA